MDFVQNALIFTGCMVVLKVIIHICKGDKPETTKIMVLRNGEMKEFDAIVINRDAVNTDIGEADEPKLKWKGYESNFYNPDSNDRFTNAGNPQYNINNPDSFKH